MGNANKLVSVLMPAYNHGKYIRQAIESFLAQKEIVAELLIGNDASTDNTLQIAMEYANDFPDKIKVISHPANLGLIGNYKNLIGHSTAPYLAILESDDYWTDPLKLHKQVEYLESHPNCGLVFSSGEFVDQAGKHLGIKQEEEGELLRFPSEGEENLLLKQVLLANPVLAVTACMRRSAFDAGCNMEEFVGKKFVTFDYPVWLGLASCSDFYKMAEVTSAYRVSDASISNNASYEKREMFMSGIDEIVEYSMERFKYCGDVEAIRNERIAKHLILALAFNKFERYSYFCKQINPAVGAKWAIIRYFPFVFKFKKRKLIGTGAISQLAVKK